MYTNKLTEDSFAWISEHDVLRLTKNVVLKALNNQYKVFRISIYEKKLYIELKNLLIYIC